METPAPAKGLSNKTISKSLERNIVLEVSVTTFYLYPLSFVYFEQTFYIVFCLDLTISSWSKLISLYYLGTKREPHGIV